ncbi:MAG: prolipoprotein diacylglyceryl transferase [Nanoarchaeales archaeon]|nr:prolipoprotein diacylglyceryl transferase [Nanoarchaeales archaeon]
MAINPIAISIFGLDIYWYGIAYVLGFLFGFWYIKKFNKIKGLSNEVLDDIAFYAVLFSIIGGRVFEIVFYQFSYYIANPTQLLAVWNGGMSIHGGILFGVLAIYYQAKKHKINPLQLIDLFIVPAALALAFGRLTNFINQELVGKVTTSSVGVVFPKVDNQVRHPYQIYLGLKNLIVFQVLFYIQEFKTTKPGTLTAWFLILFNIGRFITDVFKVPDVQVGFLTMGQILSICFIGIGIYILYKNRNK